MKKKLLFLIVAWLLPMWICAGPVDPSRAVQAAHKFAQKTPATRKAPQKGASTQPANIVYTHKMPHSGRAAFYIVNVDNAFVLVSADDVAHQVLGYCFDRNFPIAADGTVQLPPHVKSFFDDLAAQIEAAAETEPNRTPSDDWTGARKAAPRRSPSNLPESVDPLLTTTWDQGALYNTLCPEDDGGPNGHVWAGCVATAMAQIIKYWSNATHGRGTHSYDINYGTMEVNFENSFYDFANMPDALTNESTQEQINAVAKLIFDCGVAVNMGYGAGESASFNQEARAGFINYFLFSPDMSFAEKDFFTDDDWNTLLCENLAANHPVIYSGQSGNGGHTFICDGYKAGNYYHFNFGWGGFCDGWYLTSAVDVNNSSYNSSQSVLVGIVPDNEGNVILGQMKGNSTFTVNEPLEYYNLMGHNVYEGNNYGNFCDNTVTFIPADATKQMVVDVLEFEDQTVNIYNGTDANDLLRTLTGGADNDLSPVVSTANALTLNYNGNMFYAGFKLSVSQESNCRMVSNIASSVDDTTVHLTWTENGSATQWQVEYGVSGFELGNGIVYNATTNAATFENLQKFTEYDFYIRSVNGNQYSRWNKTTLMVEAPYWQDVVTSQPEGYVLNEVTNTVEISTPEALAWWSKTDANRTVSLTADIDLSAYKWRSTGGGDFNGNGHVIFNGYIIEQTNDVGFFSYYSGTVENLGLENFYVKGKGARTGGLVGQLSGTIRNCYIKNCVVDGGDYTGGLVGESNNGTVINSFVNVNSSGARWASLLIGNSYQSVVKNCYAAGSFRQRAYCYNGGIIAYSDGGAVSNCYSVEMPMGVIGYKGSTVINDTASFVKTDAGLTLLTPVVFDEQPVTNLLTALNNWVDQYNDAAINTWVADQNHVNDGYPVFGSKHVVQCPNVTDVTIQNVKTGDKNEVSVGWTENGTATQWRIRYRRHDVPDAAYTYVTTSNNPVTIQIIPLGYVYEFNVRAIGEGERKSGWSDPQYAIVDLPYWTDVVKEQPAGYLEDADGNVTISSTEGLVWLSVITNGLHGQESSSFAGKTVVLNADVDLAGYRWNPTGRFDGTFDGQGHSILNIYVNDANSCGLFGMVSLGGIKNVNMVGGSVTNTEGGSGGLIGCADDCKEITNCHSSVDVYGNGGLGSLCGAVINDDIETIISNCSASGTVYGRQSCGGLIGNVNGQVIVRNCFATGDVNLSQGETNAWYRGGLIGHSSFATILNSYSTGTVYIDPSCSSYIGRVIGCPEDSHIHYLYGQEDVNPEMELIGYPCNDISNAVLFHHEDNKNNLLSSISVNGKAYSDLTEALNVWVTYQNDAELRTWTLNPETGYPVFGDMFVPSCFNPTDLVVSNATTVDDATIKTELSWNQIGNPKSWEVLYVAAEHDVSEGTVILVTTNPCVLSDIPIGKPLDFYVRAVNNEADKSGWSKHVTFIPDKLHWTEVVTSQPEGYREDSEGNVYISSAEGLAWLSSVVNELNGVSQNSLSHKQIFLMSDIDLSAYRWTSIGNKDWWEQQYGASFNGNNHTISGLYCNELSNYQGLFGVMSGNVYNLVLTQCNVLGEQYVGAIAGYSSGNKIVNCSVNGNVCGIEEVGGIVGRHFCDDNNNIENSCFIGNVAPRRDISKVNTIVGYVGGICGAPVNNSIVNCYVVSEISDDGAWSGIITGTGGSPMLVSNCYYKKYETTLSITSDNCNTSNNSAFTGSESTWTLNTPPFINGAFYTDLVDALNAWVDANNTEGKYRYWMADTKNVNGGFPIFALMGDVNGDGNITPSDAIMILYHYFNVEQSGFNAKAADINGDNAVTPADAIEALYLYFGSRSSNVRMTRNNEKEPQ